ncbi:hypothetical protein OV203_02465 [Nannocystis sp. ILAH1]|uniref:hypothetical protein n=1 Tax=Nannocystis sp. ILAH1 TaxID=2996789 RepID=UPI00226E6703|nr:hypothetical protein [Nannocystis sp. ILAH1]MCY0985975.1 hypothetical protein [Nannocystis sp. ILAH1]
MLRALESKQDHAAVVALLERWLERAKSGEVSSIGVVAVLTERRVAIHHHVAESGLEQYALAGAAGELQRGIQLAVEPTEHT